MNARDLPEQDHGLDLFITPEYVPPAEQPCAGCNGHRVQQLEALALAVPLWHERAHRAMKSLAWFTFWLAFAALIWAVLVGMVWLAAMLVATAGPELGDIIPM